MTTLTGHVPRQPKSGGGVVDHGDILRRLVAERGP
jgi:hypothetical protein